MKEMLLSFKPDIFDLIRSGKKKYEYRHQFANEPIKAYMYVSSPVQQIVGYVILDSRIKLSDWKNTYKNDDEIIKRIDSYISRNNTYAMPIKEFHMTEPIPLSDLNQKLDRFVIPQSYYYLEKFRELENYVHCNARETGEVHTNVFRENDINHICVMSY